MVEAAGDDEKELAAQMAAEFLNEDLAEQQFGAAKAGPGMWASILRMLDPIKVNTIKLPEQPKMSSLGQNFALLVMVNLVTYPMR